LGNLLIRPATTSQKFNESDKTAGEMAKELKVDIYLKPSLLCSDDSFCVSVQLFQAGTEEKLLWSNSFVQERRNVFIIFKKSALNIAEKINLRLTPDRKSTFPRSSLSILNSLTL
jgi:TolB-like protein